MNFDGITKPLDRRLADGLTRLAAVARQLDWQAAKSAGKYLAWCPSCDSARK